MPRTLSASLQVAHHPQCEHTSRTSLDSLDADAVVGTRCTCESLNVPGRQAWPRFYTLHRDSAGRRVKGERTANFRDAERALRRLQVDIDNGRLGLGPTSRSRRTFTVWAQTYIDDVLPVRGRKGSTIRAYQPTIALGRRLFGSLNLDEIGPAELRSFVKEIRKNGASDATVSKHLRALSAILEAATEENPPLLPANPVPKFKKSQRLKVPSGDEPYTDAELARLWVAMESLGHKTTENGDVYPTVAKALVLTGCRIGELIGANWDDLNLTAGTLEVRHTWNAVDGLTLPKDGERRTVHLLPQARALFERWVALEGVQAGDRPIFAAPRSGERLNGQYVSRLVDKARVQAGIPDVGEGGRKRKPVHAFRASYTRICLEQGLAPQWVQAELGHSTADLTLTVYGQWSESARLAEAAKATGFPV